MTRFIQYFKNYSKASLLAFLACLSLLLGLFFSRALISMGMMGLFLAALIHPTFKSNLRAFGKEKSLVMLVGYFVIMSISFFWSEDKSYYFERMQIILPFLVLPFAFFSISNWKTSWFDVLLVLFSVSVTAGMTWSLFHYFSAKDSFDAGYGFSKVIPTPFKNDHIRFSLAVVASICFLTELLFNSLYKKWKKIFLILILFAVTYLHILAAKTGLLAFYLVAFAFLIKLMINKQTRTYALTGLGILISLPFIMYYASTTFRMKLSYIQYSYFEMKNSTLQANVSDEGRLISYRYALEILKLNPILGAGLGDTYNEMEKRFKRDIPDFKERALLPHNQFLMVGTAIGILGILYLLVLQFLLLIQGKQKGFLYFAVWLILAMAMMIEPLYETQYGTCLYLFLLLITWKRASEHQSN